MADSDRESYASVTVNLPRIMSPTEARPGPSSPARWGLGPEPAPSRGSDLELELPGLTQERPGSAKLLFEFFKFMEVFTVRFRRGPAADSLRPGSLSGPRLRLPARTLRLPDA